MNEIKNECRTTMLKARELQTQLGVPANELCSLPKTFHLFRNEERIESLTEQFEAIIADCKAKLAEKAKLEAAAKAAAAKARAATPEGFLESLARKAKRESARKSAMSAWQTLRAAQKELDIPSESRERLPENFADFGVTGYENLFEAYASQVIELMPTIEARRATRERLEAEYRMVLTNGNLLGGKLGKKPRQALDLTKMSNDQVRESITEMRGAISKLDALMRARSFSPARRAA